MAKQQERESKVMATFRRPDGETRLTLNTYREKQYIDLRFFWQPDDEDELKATRKGASLHVEAIPELIDALKQAADESGIDLDNA